MLTSADNQAIAFDRFCRCRFLVRTRHQAAASVQQAATLLAHARSHGQVAAAFFGERPRQKGGTSSPQVRVQSRIGEADPARLKSIAPDDVEQCALRLGHLRLAKHVEDIVGPDRFPVPRPDIHAHQDVALLDRRLRSQASG